MDTVSLTSYNFHMSYNTFKKKICQPLANVKAIICHCGILGKSMGHTL